MNALVEFLLPTRLVIGEPSVTFYGPVKNLSECKWELGKEALRNDSTRLPFLLGMGHTISVFDYRVVPPQCEHLLREPAMANNFVNLSLK